MQYSHRVARLLYFILIFAHLLCFFFCFYFFFLAPQADDNDAIHVISVGDQPTMEKPPEYDTVVILEPPCYDDAIKLNPANLLQTKYYQDILLPNYADLEITGSISMSNCSDHPTNSCRQQNDVFTTSNSSCSTNTDSNNHNINSISNSISQANSNGNNEHFVNSHNPSTVITIEQTPSDFSNEYSSRQKAGDNDSVASESTAMR